MANIPKTDASGALSDYQLMRKIGSGSYGAAFLVMHKKEKKQYVLKKVRLDNVGTKERAAAFQEVHLLSGLRHPCILRYHAHFIHMKSLCLVTDYCSGGDLYEHLKSRKKRIEEEVVIEWLVQLALSLEFLHAKKIMHRDLKTQNVFLMKQATLCLGDFGISRVLASNREMAKTVIGTPYYMSPEIMESKPYDFKSDLWALGCVMYEIMSLRHAFDADDMNGLVMKIVRGKPIPIPNFYSQSLREMVSKLLQKQPKLRPTASDILKSPFLQESVKRWRIVCENMGKERRHIVTAEDLDENMMKIMERHRYRQMNNNQEMPAQGGGGNVHDHAHLKNRNLEREQDLPAAAPPPRISLDEAVNEAEERLRQIQEQRHLIRKQQEELIKQKNIRKRIDYTSDEAAVIHPGAAGVSHVGDGRLPAPAQEKRRYSHEASEDLLKKDRGSRDKIDNTDQLQLISKLEIVEDKINEDAGSGEEIDFSVLSPKSRIWAKKQEANKKREQELKHARIQYYEQRKVANLKQQQQYSRSDETESNFSSDRSPPRHLNNVEWYDEHGTEVAVDEVVIQNNVVDVTTMRRGDYNQRCLALRNYLIDKLGENLFDVLYEFMTENNKQNGGNVEGLKKRIRDWLGADRMHCLSLVDQLIYYEEILHT